MDNVLNKYLSNNTNSKSNTGDSGSRRSLLSKWLVDNEDRYKKIREENEARQKQSEKEYQEKKAKREEIDNQVDAPPNEVFGKKSFDYFSKQQDETMKKYGKEPLSKGWKTWGYIMDTPNRIPGVNRAMDSAAKALLGEEEYDKSYTESKYNKDTGNKVLNKVADLGGNIAGLALNPGGSFGSSSMLNVADDVANSVANKVTSKMADKAGTRILNSVIKGAIDGGVGDAINTARLGGTAKEIGKNAIEGSLGGALMFGGGKSIGEGINALKGLKTPSKIEVPNSNVKLSNHNNKIDVPIENLEEIKTPGKPTEISKINPNDKVNITGNLKDSRFQSTTVNNGELADDVLKNKLKENPVQYEVKNNKNTLLNAQKAIDFDEKKAIDTVLGSGKVTAETMAMGQDLVRRLQSKGEYDTAVNIVEKLTREGTNAGQAIQALSMWKRLTPEGMLKYAQKQINKVNDNLPKGADKVKLTTDETKKITELMTRANKLSEGREQDILLAQVNKVIGDKIPSSTMDKLDSFRYINMLFNPKTLIKNAGGNVVNTTMGNVRDIIATPIDKLVSKKTGQRTVGLPNLLEQGKGLKKGIKETLEDYRLGIDTSRGAVKEGAKAKAFNNVPILGKVEDMLSAGLKLGDEPFYQATYNNYLSNAIKLNKVSEPTKQMLEDAHKAALEATFQQSTGLGNFINKGKNNENKLVSTMVKTVLPFSQTPSAILDTAANYTPIGIARGASNLKKGMQREGINQLASGILGTGLIGAGYGLGKNGMLTGELSTDYDTSTTQRQAGMQPYAIKDGDAYRSIDFAQPAATPLMMGADIASGENSLGGILATGINSIASNSYLSGLQNVAETLAYKNWGGLPGNIVKNYASQLLPFNSLSNAINKTIDPTVKDTTASSDIGKEVNKAISKIPVLSRMLPQVTDTTGEPKVYSDKGLGSRALSNFITPWNTTEFNPNSVEKKALDIYNSTGDTIQMPRVAPNTIDLGKGEKYKLTAEDKKLYSQMIGSALKNSNANAEDMQKSMTEATKKFKEIIKRGFNN